MLRVLDDRIPSGYEVGAVVRAISNHNGKCFFIRPGQLHLGNYREKRRDDIYFNVRDVKGEEVPMRGDWVLF